jgi:hypothetical protein
MAKLVFGATLLFALVAVCLPLQAQQPSVSLSVCNAGKVDIDALVAKDDHVTSSLIAPNTCADVYSEHVGLPAHLGFAFVDSHGQWGTPHRFDLLPDFGSRHDNTAAARQLLGQSSQPASEPVRVLATANQNVSVRRGNKDASAQLQFSFSPSNPACHQSQTGAASHVWTDNLPLNATSSQVATAAREDAQASANRGPLKTETVCDHFVYTLNAVAYPESRELSFEKVCARCPSKEKPASPEQQAAAHQVIGMMSTVSPTIGAMVNQGNQQVLDERQAREEQLKPPALQNWPDFNLALAKTPRSGGLPPGMPRKIAIRGTVSRIEFSLPGASEPWVDVYFKESPDGMFNVCALYPEIFQDVFGADFSTRMIGQAIEVEGRLQRSRCKGYKGSIRVTLSRQMRRIDSAQVAVTLASTVAGGQASGPAAVAPTPAAQPVHIEPGTIQQNAVTAANPARVPTAGQPVKSVSDRATSKHAAAPAPSSTATPEAKAAQEQQDRAQLNAAAQHQRQQQIAEHQKQVQERAEKYAACRQQALKDHPGGGADLVKAFSSCVQALRAK